MKWVCVFLVMVIIVSVAAMDQNQEPVFKKTEGDIEYLCDSTACCRKEWPFLMPTCYQHTLGRCFPRTVEFQMYLELKRRFQNQEIQEELVTKEIGKGSDKNPCEQWIRLCEGPTCCFDHGGKRFCISKDERGLPVPLGPCCHEKTWDRLEAGFNRQQEMRERAWKK